MKLWSDKNRQISIKGDKSRQNGKIQRRSIQHSVVESSGGPWDAKGRSKGDVVLAVQG